VPQSVGGEALKKAKMRELRAKSIKNLDRLPLEKWGYQKKKEGNLAPHGKTRRLGGRHRRKESEPDEKKRPNFGGQPSDR